MTQQLSAVLCFATARRSNQLRGGQPQQGDDGVVPSAASKTLAIAQSIVVSISRRRGNTAEGLEVTWSHFFQVDPTAHRLYLNDGSFAEFAQPAIAATGLPDATKGGEVLALCGEGELFAPHRALTSHQ